MKPGAVYVGMIHGPDFAAPTLTCWTRLFLHDLRHDQRIVSGGWSPAFCGSSRIPQGRNDTVTKMLESEAEWLFWIDSDMAFEATALEDLLAAADPNERPIVGGLCFAHHIVNVDNEYNTPITEVVPTIYGYDPDDIGFVPAVDYPRDTLVQCAATGSAFILIHRSVFEGWTDWYGQIPIGDRIVSEDISFCIKAGARGFLTHVHTGIKTKHAKTVYLDERMFDTQAPITVPEPFVVIPVKDNKKMTQALLRQLIEETDREHIVVVDNGSNPETKRWLDTQRMATVIDGTGMGIHEMWNLGAQWCLARNPRARIAFLNNDLELGPNFLAGLSAALDSDPTLVAVCPNYDARAGDGVERLHGICADKYDGTGGLAGFAFMVKGEWFERYRFPEDCMWWFGDNDLCLTIEAAGGWYGMVHGVTVVHLDGGGQTGDWSNYLDTEQGKADLAAFCARWNAVPA